MKILLVLIMLSSFLTAFPATSLGQTETVPLERQIKELPREGAEILRLDRLKRLERVPPIERMQPPAAGGPVAKIDLPYLKVYQGAHAVFRSQSVYDPDGHLIRQNWTGPNGQGGRGAVFEVETGQLAPDRYNIILEIMDNFERTSRAVATLEVIAQPAGPTARIEPSRLRVRQGERAVFTSRSRADPASDLILQDWSGPAGQAGRGGDL